MVSKGFPNVITSGRQYNMGEKPSVILYTYINLHAGTPKPKAFQSKSSGLQCSNMVLHDLVVVSHIQRIGCQPEKTTLHGGQSRSWSAEQGKENKIKSLAAYPPPHPPHCSFGENKYNHATHLQALRRSWSVSRPFKDTFGSSTRPMGVA